MRRTLFLVTALAAVVVAAQVGDKPFPDALDGPTLAAQVDNDGMLHATPADRLVLKQHLQPSAQDQIPLVDSFQATLESGELVTLERPLGHVVPPSEPPLGSPSLKAPSYQMISTTSTSSASLGADLHLEPRAWSSWHTQNLWRGESNQISTSTSALT